MHLMTCITGRFIPAICNTTASASRWLARLSYASLGKLILIRESLERPPRTASKERKQRLFEALVYRREIDCATYQQQLDKLNEGIALAEIDEREARIVEIDITNCHQLRRVRAAERAAPVG
jgi:hypothetical protein